MTRKTQLDNKPAETLIEEEDAVLDEVKIHQIGNADIAKLKYEDIMFVSLAEGGAMGEPGALNIILASKGNAKICHANFCFGDFDMDRFSEVFTPLKTFNCGLFGDASGIADGWHHVNMGMGNHLFVRDTVFPAFATAIDGKAPPKIFRCYMDVARSIIKQSGKSLTRNGVDK